MITAGKDLSGFALFFDLLKHLFLPALALGIYQVALFTRLTRSSMLEVLLLDFISTARSKGLGERRILIRHALRNALIPIVTLFGVQIGHMFSGAALVEVVFSWPGVGSLTLDAVLARDYPLLSGIFIFVSLAVVLSNLAADLIYAKLDPRIVY
jgi:peptide/nickel transport system permease protein